MTERRHHRDLCLTYLVRETHLEQQDIDAWAIPAALGKDRRTVELHPPWRADDDPLVVTLSSEAEVRDTIRLKVRLDIDYESADA